MNFDAIPKIENHLHLEGAIPLESLWELIKKYGGDPSVADFSKLEKRFIYSDFNHFIDTWIWKNQFIREYDDFSFIASAVLDDLVSQNVKYAEIFVSPSSFRKNLATQRIIEAISKSISSNKEIRVRLIIDMVRNFGAENEMRTLYEMNEVKALGVIGIGIGGSEKEFPPELFRELYEQARKFGFRTTAHAGEAAGTESIWGALRVLRVDRIGHATKAIEDPELLKYLAGHQIPLELCPLSNFRTRVIDSIESHPVKTYIEMGIPVSINTDDPKMFGNSLSDEYRNLQDVFGYSDDDITGIILNSINTLWLDENDRTDMIREFRLELTRLS
jgi:adenosine deaminase